MNTHQASEALKALSVRWDDKGFTLFNAYPLSLLLDAKNHKTTPNVVDRDKKR